MESIYGYHLEMILGKRQCLLDWLPGVSQTDDLPRCFTNQLNEHRLIFNLQVQEVPQDEFWSRPMFAGPILHVLCSSRATFLEPVIIQLPVSLGGKLANIPHPSECRVRIFFLSSKGETKEWIEISDNLENPASYDGKLVKFKVQPFSR